ncbi:putative glutathione S-transferase [Xylaria sp. FL1042]|nr:putative glutathione S-transferase [Xylaria sp. FL1042]
MATSKIILFDIPSKEPIQAWSLNTWKTRLVLNYKGLDYETEWLEYPDIKPRLQPHFPDKDHITVPTVIMPDGTYIMDSTLIAEELEKQYPSSPSLKIGSPLEQKYREHLKAAFNEAMRPLFYLNVPNRLLKEVNHAYWHKTRSEWAGMPLEQFVRENPPEKAYEKVTPQMRSITALLKENDEGPYFEGNTITYVDFVHAGFLLMFRQLGDDIFKPLLETTGDPELHLRFLEALKPWHERDNH